MNLRIEPVMAKNYNAVLSLRVAPEQENFIESTSECLAEAEEYLFWRPVGIYDDQTLIGFAMYGLFEEEGMHGRVWLDRFLIDARYQGNHYGEASLLLLLERLYREYKCDEIYLSLYEDNKSALALYKKHGFCFNNELDIHGEKVMVKKMLNFENESKGVE